MRAGNYKDYADFCRQTDYMEPEYNSPSKDELWEEWIKSWEDTFGKADKETEDILWKFFEKIVYHEYFDNWTIYSDWSLQEIKDKLLEWYMDKYEKLINQFGNLIRENQRRDLKDKCEETETLKKSRLLYTNQTGSCI